MRNCLLLVLFMTLLAPGRGRAADAQLSGQPSEELPWVEEEPALATDTAWLRPRPSDRAAGGEPWGAEDDTSEDDRPRIPEPMLFDLMRPLGARRGELEFNVLGLVPFRRCVPRASSIPDSLGIVTTDRLPRIEWAPEVEYAIWDGVALEFELPMEDGIVAAYKGGAQVTFGTAFDRKFIHGMQVILQYEVEPRFWLPTFLYLAGVRFDETWSALAMLGMRNEIPAETTADRALSVVNLSLFADLAPRASAGVETNYSANMRGNRSLFVIPQFHYEVTERMMLQSGVAVRFTESYTLPEAVFRLIRNF